MRRFISLAVVAAITVVLAFQAFVSHASELSEENRTVALNEAGDTIVVSRREYLLGRRLFVNACAQCHINGSNKTNPNIGLDLETLSYANPRRDNLEALVDFMENPTSYDGEIEISEYHPSISSADIFPEMRNLTNDDLEALAGYILVQPNVDPQWGQDQSTR